MNYLGRTFKSMPNIIDKQISTLVEMNQRLIDEGLVDDPRITKAAKHYNVSSHTYKVYLSIKNESELLNTTFNVTANRYRNLYPGNNQVIDEAVELNERLKPIVQEVYNAPVDAAPVYKVSPISVGYQSKRQGILEAPKDSKIDKYILPAALAAGAFIAAKNFL